MQGRNIYDGCCQLDIQFSKWVNIKIIAPYLNNLLQLSLLGKAFTKYYSSHAALMNCKLITIMSVLGNLYAEL